MYRREYLSLISMMLIWKQHKISCSVTVIQKSDSCFIPKLPPCATRGVEIDGCFALVAGG